MKKFIYPILACMSVVSSGQVFAEEGEVVKPRLAMMPEPTPENPNPTMPQPEPGEVIIQ